MAFGALRTRIWRPQPFAVVASLFAVVLGVFVFQFDPKASASVAIADASIWFETGAAGAIVEVNSESLDVQNTIQVAEAGQKISAHAGSSRVAVANHDTRTLVLVDRATHRITHLMDLGVAEGDIELHGTGDLVVVVGGARVDRIDLATFEHTVVGSAAAALRMPCFLARTSLP